MFIPKNARSCLEVVDHWESSFHFYFYERTQTSLNNYYLIENIHSIIVCEDVNIKLLTSLILAFLFYENLTVLKIMLAKR